MDTIRQPFGGVRQTVLEEIDLEVEEGEIFGLLGQNGAGKSTLFKILATLILPDRGRAEIGGFDLLREPDRIRTILTPVIPNERSLYWRLSAHENLRLYAALYGLPPRERDEQIEALLQVVGLGDAQEKQVGLFSSGMRQRLLVARALLARPRVLLLDEPTRSLDPIGARDFRNFLRYEVAERQGCTILLATHDPQEVADLCTRIGVLERGHLRAVGVAGTLLEELQLHRYRLWTREPDHLELGTLEERWQAGRIERIPGAEEGWTRIAFDLPTGSDGAADLLRHLAGAGVPIGRFEKVELPLAELIERVASKNRAEVEGVGDRPTAQGGGDR